MAEKHKGTTVSGDEVCHCYQGGGFHPRSSCGANCECCDPGGNRAVEDRIRGSIPTDNMYPIYEGKGQPTYPAYISVMMCPINPNSPIFDTYGVIDGITPNPSHIGKKIGIFFGGSNVAFKVMGIPGFPTSLPSYWVPPPTKHFTTNTNTPCPIFPSDGYDGDGEFYGQHIRKESNFSGDIWFNYNSIEKPLWFNASADEESDIISENVTDPVDRPTQKPAPQGTKDTETSIPTGTGPTDPTPVRDRSSNGGSEGAKEQLTIRGNLNNMEGFVRQAQAQGKMIGISPSQAKDTIMSIIMEGTDGGTNPGKRKWWQCGKDCSYWKAKTGKCAFGGCLMLGGWPPSEFTIGWDI